MEQSIKKEVIILGMHRSGTSMIAGILECLGVNLGENQLGKQWFNPLGHFEDVDFLSLNKDILASAGGSWDQPPSNTAILAQGDQFQKKIGDLIHTRNKHNLVGINIKTTAVNSNIIRYYKVKILFLQLGSSISQQMITFGSKTNLYQSSFYFA